MPDGMLAWRQLYNAPRLLRCCGRARKWWIALMPALARIAGNSTADTSPRYQVHARITFYPAGGLVRVGGGRQG